MLCKPELPHRMQCVVAHHQRLASILMANCTHRKVSTRWWNLSQRKEAKSLTQGWRKFWIRNHCAQNAFPASINFLSGICLHIFSYFNLVSLNRKFATAAPGDTPPSLRGILVVLIKLTFHFNEFPSLTMGFFPASHKYKTTELLN